MIDPLTKLAYAVQANPGGYVALLGSGVSRAAGVPTAWEVVERLILQLPEAQPSGDVIDPVTWYRHHYSRDVAFASLLEELAPHSTDRASILQSILGKPSPTEAHKSLARLARLGYVKIIITTNFDSLMETALYSLELDPLVIATESAAHSAEPLHRLARPVLVKLHGDYNQPDSMLATEQELASYSAQIEQLLKRTLDDYGLLIVGWSGEHDKALREAIASRSPRYPLWYVQRQHAPNFIVEMQDARDAFIIPASSADQACSDLERKIEAIATYATPRPSSVDALAAELKFLVATSANPLELHELVSREVENCYNQFIDHDRFPYHFEGQREKNLDDVFVRIGLDYLNTTAAAAHLMAIGCAWTDTTHHSLWRRAIERIANLPVIGQDQPTSLVYLRELRNLPWMLLLYSGCIGAISRGKLDIIRVLCRDALIHDDFHTEKVSIVEHEPLAYYCCKDDRQWRLLNETVVALSADSSVDRISFFTPVSDLLYIAARGPLRHLLLDDDEYADFFDRTELVLNLLAADFVLTEYRGRTPKSLVGWPLVGPWPGRYSQPRGRPESSMIEKSENEMNSGTPFWQELDRVLFENNGSRRASALALIKDLRSRWSSSSGHPRSTV